MAKQTATDKMLLLTAPTHRSHIKHKQRIESGVMQSGINKNKKKTGQTAMIRN